MEQNAVGELICDGDTYEILWSFFILLPLLEGGLDVFTFVHTRHGVSLLLLLY